MLGCRQQNWLRKSEAVECKKIFAVTLLALATNKIKIFASGCLSILGVFGITVIKKKDSK